MAGTKKASAKASKTARKATNGTDKNPSPPPSPLSSTTMISVYAIGIISVATAIFLSSSSSSSSFMTLPRTLLEASVGSSKVDDGNSLTVTLFPNGGGEGKTITYRSRQELIDDLGISSSFYSEIGLKQDLTKVENNTSLYRAPTTKGTHFFYPLLPVGSKIKIPDIKSPSGKTIELEVLSHEPRVFYVHNFMADSETDQLIDFATSEKNPYKMSQSTGGTHKSWNQGGRGDVLSTRTSMNAFDLQTQASKDIKRRVFDLLRIPTYVESMADGIQVLRYELTQAYIAHHDYFPTHTPDHNWDPSKGGSNRMATVFLYLSDVEYGGQTCFPKTDRLDENKHPELVKRLGEKPSEEVISQLLKDANITEGSWEAKLTRNCYNKFAVPPKKGDAVLFYSQTPDGQLDPSSLHGAGPVLKGTKWGANVWVWNACRYSLCKDEFNPTNEIEFEY